MYLQDGKSKRALNKVCRDWKFEYGSDQPLFVSTKAGENPAPAITNLYQVSNRK